MLEYFDDACSFGTEGCTEPKIVLNHLETQPELYRLYTVILRLLF